MTRKEVVMYLIIDEKNKGKKRKTKLSVVAANKNFGTVKLAKSTNLENGQISNYLSGVQTNMMLDTAKKICNVLGSSLDETFGEGEIDFKTKLLNKLQLEIMKLDGRDAEGHLWFNKFKDMVINISEITLPENG